MARLKMMWHSYEFSKLNSTPYHLSFVGNTQAGFHLNRCSKLNVKNEFKNYINELEFYQKKIKPTI